MTTPTRPARGAVQRGRVRQALTLGFIATTLALAYGSWYAYSVFLVALLEEFAWPRSALGGAFSLFALVQGSMNPVLGMLCDRVRPPILVGIGGVALGATLFANSFIASVWQLYLYFGIATALAVALCGWIPAVVQVQRRFHRRLGLALGIVSSGVGVGMIVIVPICQFLIDEYGWRMAFRLLGGLCAVCIVPAAFYLLRESPRRKRPAAVTAASVAAEPSLEMHSITLKQAVRSKPFWLLVTAFFGGSLCSQTLHVHQVAFLVDHGVSAMIAASVVGVVGGASIVGKTGGGWLSDRFERELIYVSGIGFLIAAVGALILVGQAASAVGAYGYAVLLGIGYAVTAALTPAMVSDRFQGRHFGAIIGVGLFGSAAGSASGPWLAGWLHDVTGSYTLPFAIAAGFGALSGACGWGARRLRLRARGRVESRASFSTRCARCRTRRPRFYEGNAMQLSSSITAVVTGGSSGLGAATARALAARGCKVALFDLNVPLGEALAKEIGGVFCKVNVCSDADVDAGLAAARAALGQERILLNCAGTGNAIKTASRDKQTGAIKHFPLDAFEKIIQINLIGTFRCIAKSAAGMLTLEPLDQYGERGVIVNTASVAAEDGQIGQASYSASKAGVVGMTLPIARDLMNDGIRVNTILPGIFDTPLLQSAPDNVKASLAASVPFPKRLGVPAEFAHLALTMIENGYFNGESVRLDGAIRMAPR